MPKVGMEPIRRRELIRAVLWIIANKGFEEVTLDKVALRAGVSKGVVAYYFKNKEMLINESCKAFLVQFSSGITQLIEREMDAYTILSVIGLTSIGHLEEAYELCAELPEGENELEYMDSFSIAESQSIMMQMFGRMGTNPDFKNLLKEVYQVYHSAISAIFKKGLPNSDWNACQGDALQYMALIDGLAIYGTMQLPLNRALEINRYLDMVFQRPSRINRFNERSIEVYTERINLVQDYIETHLEAELTVAMLAEIASFSKFHFQRLFRLVTGESLYGYIKRLRLEKAVFLLKTDLKRTIQDIALTSGFSNQASFAKALKECYGMSASAMRKSSELETVDEMRNNGKVLNSELSYNEPMDFRIEVMSPVRVLYIRHVGRYKGDSRLFGNLFNELYTYAKHLGVLDGKNRWFVLYHDFSELTEDEKLRMSICVSIEQEIKPDGKFGLMQIEGGKYAIGRFNVKPDAYQAAWNTMLLRCIPDHHLTPDDRMNFEHYPPHDEIQNESRVVEIYVPIA
ncbi:GyrI-like domain-containing protein [Fusibacter sp. 3D3]|uniref:GyrI-like domain-containing protein n=1 Tax=Fusibacter sp. 3D3 TaxID=1048380 RepID=UPI000853A4AD|nr:GyrI-like domain-containing protein [Fusibacter sp. 3D3]GAU75551.1 HTH-type transcriptional regulator BetI [Fusibacter sp. 3D3]